jgi:hypothetical protein
VLVLGTRGLQPDQDPRIAYFQRESRKISYSESRCIGEVSASSDHQIASIAASPGASNSDQGQQVARERNESLDRCKTNAARQKQVLSERERKAYQDNAQEQRDHESLMMILISGPR